MELVIISSFTSMIYILAVLEYWHTALQLHKKKNVEYLNKITLALGNIQTQNNYMHL